MQYARLFLVLATPVVGMVPLASAQGTYPTRPLRLIVGFAAGGPTDIPARLIADKLGDLLGQRVVVENKPAAAGMLATREVLAQPRDGYTLLLCNFGSINVAVYKTRNTSSTASRRSRSSPATTTGSGCGCVPVKTTKEFIALAKSRLGQILYGSAGIGAYQHLATSTFANMAGISMNRVPYRAGTQIVQDMIPGRVQFYVAPMIQLLPFAQEKQLKILGVSNTERLKSAPQVATLREQGIDFVRFGWLDLCGAGTPQPIIDMLNRHIATIVAARVSLDRARDQSRLTPAELRR
jgi:tripartite-type tricarboxylate transporter receptor subunit TctC